MVVRARCKECGEIGRCDIGEIKGRGADGEIGVAEAQEKFDDIDISSCPFSHHVELSPIRYEVLELLPEERVKTDEEWLAEMSQKYDLWLTDELRPAGIEITGFVMGFPLAEVGGRHLNLDFFEAPTTRTRYYYARKGALEEAKQAAA